MIYNEPVSHSSFCDLFLFCNSSWSNCPRSSKLPYKNALCCHFCPAKWQILKVGDDSCPLNHRSWTGRAVSYLLALCGRLSILENNKLMQIWEDSRQIIMDYNKFITIELFLCDKLQRKDLVIIYDHENMCATKIEESYPTRQSYFPLVGLWFPTLKSISSKLTLKTNLRCPHLLFVFVLYNKNVKLLFTYFIYYFQSIYV